MDPSATHRPTLLFLPPSGWPENCRCAKPRFMERKPVFLFCFICLHSQRLFWQLIHSGWGVGGEGWPRSSCHKSFPLLLFCGTCAKTTQDKRHFQYVVYFPLVVKEWKFRKEKPLKETITAERAECGQRQRGSFWGAALSGTWNKRAKLGGPRGQNSK